MAFVAAVLTVSVAGVAFASPGLLTIDAPGEVTVAAVRGKAIAPPIPEHSRACPDSGHAAVIDRAAQRAWLCTDGVAADKFPITTAITQPDPGRYKVYAKDRMTTSTFGGHFSYLDNFVAFARGKFTGARVAFHAVPRTAGGAPYQPYDTVGTQAWYGESSGCIRVIPDQSRIIWDHLSLGDAVIVIT
jgi:hypothetical protein